MKKLYYNGNILTMAAEGEEKEALLTEDQIIRATGSLIELKDKYPDAELINLKGKTLMPAFIDGHSHFLLSMQTAGMADLSGCSSFEDIVTVMKEYIRQNQITEHDAAMGWGYDHNFLPGETHPGKNILDRISTEIPICVVHTSGHMGCMNTPALIAAGITSETKDPHGGKIGRLSRTGEPNGYLEETAMFQGMTSVAGRIPIRNMPSIKMAEKIYLENGITTVQDGASSRQSAETLTRLDQAGSIHVDVIMYPLMEDDGPEILKDFSDYAGHYKGHIKIGGYKLILDGSPQGKSAWLTKPYENSGTYCGYPRYTDEQVTKFITCALEDGQQVLAHCNGDAASDQFLNCYSNALKKHSDLHKKDLRPVMIHCQTTRKDQFDRMKDLNMIPSIFTGHIYYWGDIHIKNLGSTRGNQISPCRWAEDAGLQLNLHQDMPVTRPNMLHSIWCAVNRISRSGNIIGKRQKITVYEAFRAASYGGAYSYHEENVKGTLEPGKIADMIIIDHNPFVIDPMSIREIKVIETIKNGKTLYKNGNLTY